MPVTCGRLVFFSGTLVSSTNKTSRHGVTEILLKVTLTTNNSNPLKHFQTINFKHVLPVSLGDSFTVDSSTQDCVTVSSLLLWLKSEMYCMINKCLKWRIYKTRGSVVWACVAHLSFCFEEKLIQNLPDASHQISVHLAKQFQRRGFLEIDRPETRIVYGMFVC